MHEFERKRTRAGLVLMEKIHHLEVEFFDVDGDGKVDMRDLVKTAKRYKAVP
jgi:hypothetical protein